MIADVYLRISDDKTGEELGVDRQRKRCQAMIEARGWTLGVEHTDNDRSATDHRKIRPGFEAMMKRVEAGQVKAVIAWHLDRLLRNRYDQLRLFEAAEEHEMILSFIEGSDIDMSTAAGQLVADVLAGQARSEVRLKAKRQREGAQQAAEMGKPPAGPVPFGFMPDRVTHRPEQAEAIRKAYRTLLAGGTLASIARAWNAAGLVSGHVRTGRRLKGQPSEWNAVTVRRLLLNPRNVGLRAYRGEVIGPALWEGFIEEEVWRAAVALLTDPARTKRKPTPRYLLSGVALCGKCDNFVTAGPNYGGVHRYRCGENGVGHVARRGDHVDEWIGALVVERLSRADAVELLKPPTNGASIPELRSQRATLNLRLEQLAIEFAEDEIDRAQLRVGTARLKEKIFAVDEALQEAGRADILAPLVGVNDVQKVWDGMANDLKRPVVDLLMSIKLHSPGKGARYFNPDSVEVVPKRG